MYKDTFKMQTWGNLANNFARDSYEFLCGVPSLLQVAYKEALLLVAQVEANKVGPTQFEAASIELMTMIG